MKNELKDTQIFDLVLPGVKCGKCGAPLVIFDGIIGENNTLYVGCPEGTAEDGHTFYSNIPISTLRELRWEIPPHFEIL
jgi:hypothetical protein